MDQTNFAKQKEREKLIQTVKNFEKTPWVFLIRKSKLTYLIIIFLLIFGLLTIKNLPKELQPEVEIPYAIVAIAYPGASPLDVEEQITKKIENQIFNLSGIKNIESTSSLGISSIVVEFEAGENLAESIRKLKDEVQKTESDMPADATVPQVIEINISDEPIFVATLNSDDYDIADLKKFAQNLEDKLKGIPYVSEVKVVGGKDKIIEVDVNQEKLAQKNIALSVVSGMLAANNANFPLGVLTLDNYKYSLRIQGEFKTAEEIAKLPISYIEGRPVLLEDVAVVRESFSQETSKSRLSINQETPKKAVSVQIYKKTGGDITKVAQEADNIVKEARGIDFPEDLGVEITTNNASYITDSINTLSSNGVQTVLIILILLFIFMGWREALLAGLSVPFSFFIAFIVMSIAGESLNFLSLFALVLALGLLVDSAVVIVEDMYRKVAKFKISGYQAAILTIQEYAAPLLSGMLTTVAAFFPLMFVKGIIGEFLKVIPIVVNSTLIAALFVSLTIIPAVGALILKPKFKEEEKEKSFEKCGFFKMIFGMIRKRCHSKPREMRLASRIFDKIANYYYGIIQQLVSRKKYRRILISGVIILFFLSLILPISGFLKIKSFGEVDSEYFFVNIEMPKGTILDKTDEEVKKAEEIILKEKEVVNFTTSVGSGVGTDIASFGGDGQTYKASIKINLTAKEKREVKSEEIVDRIRKEMEKNITTAKLNFIQEESGPPGGSPIELRVVGDDLLVLEKLAEEIRDELIQIPTVIETEVSVDSSPGEFVFIPNKDLLIREGLSVIQLASEFRKGISRDSEIQIIHEGDKIKIDVGFDEDQLKSISEMQSILIVAPSGKKITLDQLGEIKLNSSLASIRHKDKERIIAITANTQGGNPTEITQELQKKLINFDLPQGYRIDYGGEQAELTEVYQDMVLKMIIGIILILFILVIQFNSYKQVLIIFSTIPLALIGVFVGMASARLILDIPAFIGIVSLAGIVVNNAIILIDQINREIKNKKGLIEAACFSGYSRLRPILLTSITTIAGLLPLSITQPDWRNMGFTIIFGLVFSTFLTLFVVPTLFVSFYKKRLGKFIK